MRQRDSLLEAMIAFRAVSKRVTVSEIVAFLYTCENEGLSVQEFAYIAGFSQSAASRNLRALGRPDIPWSLDPALGLVEPYLSPQDARSHVLHLSEKGHRLRERLDEIIGQAVPIGRQAGAQTGGQPDVQTGPQLNVPLRDLGLP